MIEDQNFIFETDLLNTTWAHKSWYCLECSCPVKECKLKGFNKALLIQERLLKILKGNVFEVDMGFQIQCKML